MEGVTETEIIERVTGIIEGVIETEIIEGVTEIIEGVTEIMQKYFLFLDEIVWWNLHSNRLCETILMMDQSMF